MAISSSEEYRVKLEAFEGPLDLLLHLIRQDDLDIRNIPIAAILDQYLDYLKLMKELNMDIAGEFILMASELALIKSRMLLPVAEAPPGGEEIDPRAELVERLLEYQRYKAASQELAGRPLLGRDVFLHPQEPLPAAGGDEPELPLLEVDGWKLLEAFRGAMAKAPAEEVEEIERDGLSVRERIMELLQRFQRDKTVLLSTLLEGTRTQGLLVLTFLALLEMTRLKMIRIYQPHRLADIHIESMVGEAHKEDLDGLSPA